MSNRLAWLRIPDGLNVVLVIMAGWWLQHRGVYGLRAFGVMLVLNSLSWALSPNARGPWPRGEPAKLAALVMLYLCGMLLSSAALTQWGGENAMPLVWPIVPALAAFWWASTIRVRHLSRDRDIRGREAAQHQPSESSRTAP